MNFTQLANKEKQKRHLACMMAYGKDMPETPHGPKILHRTKREPEIPENADFLNDCKLPVSRMG